MSNFHPDRQAEVVSCSGSLVQSRCGEGAVSLSMLLRLPAVLYGVCPALRAVPVFGSSTKVWTRLRLRFVPSPAGTAQAAGSLTGTLSPGAVHLLPSAAPASVSAHGSQVCEPCV